MKKNAQNNKNQEIKEELVSDSFHRDYLHMALEAFETCQNHTNPSKQWYLNRHIIDTIIYAYTCIEASIEFIYQFGTGRGQSGPNKVPENWLTRQLDQRRMWTKLSVHEKLGFMAYAWLGRGFWKHDTQRRLFDDLRAIRDGLIHLKVYSWHGNEDPCTWGDEFKESKHFLIQTPKNAVATFTNNPRHLNYQDAEQAVEILVRMLLLLEESFTFSGDLTYVLTFPEKGEHISRSGEDFLAEISCRFEKQWKQGDLTTTPQR